MKQVYKTFAYMIKIEKEEKQVLEFLDFFLEAGNSANSPVVKELPVG